MEEQPGWPQEKATNPDWLSLLMGFACSLGKAISLSYSLAAEFHIALPCGEKPAPKLRSDKATWNAAIRRPEQKQPILSTELETQHLGLCCVVVGLSN